MNCRASRVLPCLPMRIPEPSLSMSRPEPAFLAEVHGDLGGEAHAVQEPAGEVDDLRLELAVRPPGARCAGQGAAPAAPRRAPAPRRPPPPPRAPPGGARGSSPCRRGRGCPGLLASTISKSISFRSRPSSSMALSIASFSFLPSNSSQPCQSPWTRIAAATVSRGIRSSLARLFQGLRAGLGAAFHQHRSLAGLRVLLLLAAC